MVRYVDVLEVYRVQGIPMRGRKSKAMYNKVNARREGNLEERTSYLAISPSSHASKTSSLRQLSTPMFMSLRGRVGKGFDLHESHDLET